MKINIRSVFSKFRKSISSVIESASKKISVFKSARKELVKDLEKAMPELINFKKIGDEFPAPHLEKTEKGVVRIGGTDIGDLEFHLESGRIRKVFSSLGMENVISEEVEKGIQKQINYPAKKIADLEEEIVTLKKGKMKDYDVPIDEVKEKLSKTQQNKLIDHYNTGWKKVAATGGVALVGVVALGIDQLIQECHKAKGCFLFNSETGEVGRCKLENRSCAYKDHPHRIPQCNSKEMDKLMPNLNLVMRYLKKNSNAPLFTAFESFLNNKLPKEETIIGETIDKMKNNKTITNKDIEYFIQRPGFEEKLNQFCEDNKSSLEITDFCDLLDVEERAETACVACNPSAPHNSLQYVNIEDLPDTLRPRCDENPTLWEAFVKICGDTPRDIADALGVTQAWKTIMMWVGVFIGVMVLFIGIGYLVYMFRKKGEDDEISYSELENEDDEDDNHEHHEDEHHRDEHHKDEKKTEESKV
ncbi:GSCOCT00014107001.2-RA-CDS [Cotesia congregata]|uniref:Cc_pif5_2a n=1 Tax=Cotesia congregata TaxID=51543 RepID=B9W489_COTCN|nr:GSCOCT00014107001.2-RA-CDS [Cotesia congregata]CAG5073913.1 Cc_pif5_2a [Cotesia congregata]CAR31577.1 putative envelope protein ODV-E56-1 protein [Cotesia congregata]CAR82254.1 putative viral envelope protein ODV-E56 [Cotesia congregata]